MITQAEADAIQAKVANGEMPTPEELAAFSEFVTEQAKAQLAANPARVVCKRCNGENTVAAIDGVVRCEWCGEPLTMDDFAG
ncbi:MAG: hypothetical protein IJ111_03830 [Eggerthellaceae bacterium]|nr:hypothetical protein [Eggerthellaceae bacterium]